MSTWITSPKNIEFILISVPKYKLLKSILEGKVFGDREDPDEEGYHGSRT
jgi:hypothetical protein